MESLISYYYHININSIIQNNGDYLIKDEDNEYLLCKLEEPIEELMSIVNCLNKTSIKYHLLVLTIEGKLFITYDEKNYCLFKVRTSKNERLSLQTFSQIKENSKCNWGSIWSERIDYYETQVEEVIKEPSIKYALQYYIGLTEIAIYYFNVLKEKYTESELIYSICHKRINSPVNYLNYYNPCNMIIDLEIRDLAEYFKSAFFNETLTESELLDLINHIKFSDVMANYLFLRLLYPSYYFDIHDEYIESREIDDKMIHIIKKSKDYESLLNKVYNRLKQNNNILIKLWFLK